VVKLPSACIWRKGKDVVTSRVVLRFGNERYRAAVSLAQVDERSDGNGGVRKNSSVFGKRIGARYGQVPRTSQWVDAMSLPERRPHCPFTLAPFLNASQPPHRVVGRVAAWSKVIRSTTVMGSEPNGIFAPQHSVKSFANSFAILLQTLLPQSRLLTGCKTSGIDSLYYT
jgi:hypothetical protein